MTKEIQREPFEIEEPLLSLVRRGIGKPASIKSLSFEWQHVYALAQEQGLSAIILDGIDKYPEELRPPKELTHRWIGEVLQSYEFRYVDYEKAIGELAGFYNKHGIKMMVLKGYGLSSNYPNPKHRPCGDIDIWNFGKQKGADDVLAKELGITVDTREHHHTVFCWNNYMVENHFDILIKTASKSNGELEPLLKDLAMDDSNSTEINGQVVFLPSANFNALFLLRHMLMHFVAMGITIRHLLDWAFFWEKHGGEVDVSWYVGVLERFKMTTFFHIVNAICVDDLGFEEEFFPSVEVDSALKKRVLKDILFPKYNWKEASCSEIAKRLVFKYKRWKGSAWKREICYNESNWSSFWTSVWSHLLKPSSI